MSILKRFKKEKEETEKYIISNEELEKYKNRGIELKDLIKEALRNQDYTLAKEYSCELADIIKFLRKVKKYANKTS